MASSNYYDRSGISHFLVHRLSLIVDLQFAAY